MGFMMKRNKWIFFIYSTLTICSSVAKGAQAPLGKLITQTSDITFRQTSGIKFRLTPVNDLKVGKNLGNTTVATFEVTSDKPCQLGVRFVPFSDVITKNVYHTINGKYNPAHKLLVSGRLFGKGIDSIDDITGLNHGWAITKRKATTLKGKVILDYQIVSADVYTLTMDASAFIS